MACFLVSAAAGIGVTAAKYVVKHFEKKNELKVSEPKEVKFGSEIKWSKKLAFLELTLFAGSFVLAGEHMIHGEIVPFPPFLTAMANPGDTAEMLHEMGTTGVLMLGLLVAAWAVGVFIADLVKYRKHKKALKAKLEEAK